MKDSEVLIRVLVGNLLGEPQDVRRVGPGRLETDHVANDEGASDGIGGRSDVAEYGILHRVVIETEIDDAAIEQWVACAKHIADRQDPFVARFLESSL